MAQGHCPEVGTVLALTTVPGEDRGLLVSIQPLTLATNRTHGSAAPPHPVVFAACPQCNGRGSAVAIVAENRERLVTYRCQ